jgi:hypothetical protein
VVVGGREEIAALSWPQLRAVGDEYHFESVGKRGVEKWFRVPEGLYRELRALRTDSPYVFAAYNDQLRLFYEGSPNPCTVVRVGPQFQPANLAQWFYRRVRDWSASSPKGRATTHILRKTAMQHARRGEDINRLVAGDVGVSPAVMMNHYVKETDEELRPMSNRTYHRILKSLPPEVARRYGHVESKVGLLQERLNVAYAAQDWALVAPPCYRPTPPRTSGAVGPWSLGRPRGNIHDLGLWIGILRDGRNNSPGSTPVQADRESY